MAGRKRETERERGADFELELMFDWDFPRGFCFVIFVACQNTKTLFMEYSIPLSCTIAPGSKKTNPRHLRCCKAPDAIHHGRRELLLSVRLRRWRGMCCTTTALRGLRSFEIGSECSFAHARTSTAECSGCAVRVIESSVNVEKGGLETVHLQASRASLRACVALCFETRPGILVAPGVGT
jgi:hypothetical protein